MKTLISIFFDGIAIALILLLAVACGGGGKSMTLEQEARVAGIIEGSRLAGTINLTGNSESILVNCEDLRIESGQPMMVVPRVTTSGLVIDVYVISPPKECGIESENF